ncbi:hypothetical protein Glove_441g78 [Diversispora epigaea]|uniref:Galactose oxidase n=1 Tax=Diversispora epigaea TaxID=1348612 RepID=A0A397GR62_9GLOM|nr:hypothetical protein Glove_441g78 [Diversispora epigaea]
MYLPPIFFTLLLLINSILCYNPLNRYLHNSIIIDNRLLILGGFTNTTGSYELFYLNLLKPFDNNNLTWTLIPEGNLTVYVYRSTSILSTDNSTIYLIGGVKMNQNGYYDFSNPFYTYNYPTSKWDTPKIIGNGVPIRQSIEGVIDNFGIIYLFGGYNVTNFTDFTGELYNDIYSFNTVSMAWTTLSTSGDIPKPCSGYSANILPNGYIVYIGGVEPNALNINFTLVKINNIKLFNTKSYKWSQMNAIGDIVDSRTSHNSILTPDGHIIIFGGRTQEYTSVSPILALLDTNTYPYEWSIPGGASFNSPPSIYGSTANLYYNYMIITFGRNINTLEYNSKVYLYDIKSNTWVTSFVPTNTLTTNNSTNINDSSTNTTNSSKSLAIGLGFTIAAIIIIISCIAIFIIYRRKKREEMMKKKEAIANEEETGERDIETGERDIETEESDIETQTNEGSESGAPPNPPNPPPNPSDNRLFRILIFI